MTASHLITHLFASSKDSQVISSVMCLLKQQNDSTDNEFNNCMVWFTLRCGRNGTDPDVQQWLMGKHDACEKHLKTLTSCTNFMKSPDHEL